MSSQPEISQRDLRLRSKEIMDSVEAGRSFTVTRDGRQIGELIPLRAKRTFVPREEFLAAFRGASFQGAATLDPDRIRAEGDRFLDDSLHDPYDR